MTTPALSVIICTHNRARDALECVAALRSAPGFSRIEVIVVDNVSNVDNRNLLEQGVVSTEVTLLREPQPGLSYARNLGLSLARAPWIAYLDDDALPFPTWTTRALELVEHSGEAVGLIGGAVLPRWPSTPNAEDVDPQHLGTRWRDLLSLVEAEELYANSGVPHVVGCNLLVRRDILQQLGGFPTDLGRTPDRLLGGEEIAIARRIAARGLRVNFDSALCVYHKIASERLRPAWIKKRAEAEGELLWKCAPRAMTKVLLSIPYLALASRLRALPSGAPRDYDHHVRLWHNLGFLKSALGSVIAKASSRQPSGSRPRSTPVSPATTSTTEQSPK